VSTPSSGFVLFVIVTGVLFVRPTELVGSLKDAPVYEVSILCCLAVAAPQLLGQLTTRSLRTRPTTLCVLGLLVAVALSRLSHFAVEEAVAWTWRFFKVVVSYLLLVGVVDTLARLRWYLRWLFVFILALTTLALLQHHGIIDNPALAAHQERLFDRETGEVLGVNVRLCGAGIFANPNDLARILVVGIALSLYFFDGGAPALLRPVWVVAAGAFGYALLLTQSRGGLIALMVTLAVVSRVRFGLVRTVLLMGAALPILAVAVGGRQTDLSASEGTGQQRIRLWSDGFEAVWSSPLFGLGAGSYPEITGGLGAHNSFIETYVELGLFGGTLFFGAVFCALRMMDLLGERRSAPSDPELRRLRPYLLAVLAGYAAGMLSSSRCYAIPTYMLLGLAVAYTRLAGAGVSLPSFRVTPRLIVRLVWLSVLVLIAFKLYILGSARFGTNN
jgi:hypothetical protein